MSWRRIQLIFQREIRDQMRDRRTLFMIAVVPLLLYPALGIGMVQMRWGHLNRRFSILTQIQSIFLDGHLVIEHTARNRSGRFFNFNGTAGVFRRSCIEDAGGWQHDTLTEDMDLSYRAQLRGWKFAYLPRVTCPAELPVEMPAFLNQQHRWAKGSIQTARKLLRSIWRAPISMLTKVEAGFHLLGNLAFPLLMILIRNLSAPRPPGCCPSIAVSRNS